MVFQLVCEPYGVYLVAYALLHRLEHILGGGVFLLKRLFLLLAVEVQIIVADVHKLLAVVFAHHFERELVYVLGKVKYLVALVLYCVGLGEHFYLLVGLAAGVVDIVLSFFHTFNIFF